VIIFVTVSKALEQIKRQYALVNNLVKRFIPIFFILLSCSGETSNNKVEISKNVKTTLNPETNVSYSILSNNLMDADSVIIVSHESTNYPGEDKKTGKTLPAPKLIMNGMPNDSIIHERKRLDKKHISTLDRILTAPAVKPEIVTSCFQPRHAVFIYKKGNLSYMDFCFECHDYSISSDLTTEIILDEPKWDKLNKFVKGLGLKYELY
jgi:hypothetical protein